MLPLYANLIAIMYKDLQKLLYAKQVVGCFGKPTKVFKFLEVNLSNSIHHEHVNVHA